MHLNNNGENITVVTDNVLNTMEGFESRYFVIPYITLNCEDV